MACNGTVHISWQAVVRRAPTNTLKQATVLKAVANNHGSARNAGSPQLWAAGNHDNSKLLRLAVSCMPLTAQGHQSHEQHHHSSAPGTVM